MHRLDFLLKGITKDMLGIEIGPYHQPLVPKCQGYRSFSIDVFDTEALRRNAATDPAISKEQADQIEEVDLIGSAANMAELVESKGIAGQCDYVISSHNFEHIPDPIRFLQGCERALKPNGFVSMALPDKRCCYDYYRPLSMTGDFLEAYFEKRERPSHAQIFAADSLNCRLVGNNIESTSFELTTDPDLLEPNRDLKQSFENWRTSGSGPSDSYRDAHCWAMTPSSFEIVARDFHFLGLSKLGLESVSGTHGNEFYVRLVNGTPPPEASQFYECRAGLLREIATPCHNGSFKQRNADLEAEIAAIKLSRSWRWTEPLRWVRTFLGQNRSSYPAQTERTFRALS